MTAEQIVRGLMKDNDLSVCAECEMVSCSDHCQTYGNKWKVIYEIDGAEMELALEQARELDRKIGGLDE